MPRAKLPIGCQAEWLGGRGLFAGLVSSSAGTRPRPAPFSFTDALERPRRPVGAAVIGDTVIDIKTAPKLGRPASAS